MSSCFTAVSVAAVTLAFTAHAGAGDDLIPLEHFARLPAISDPVVAPDGHAVAGLVPLDGRRVLAILPLHPTKEDRPASVRINDAEIDWVQWAANDRLLISASFPSVRYGTDLVEQRLIGANPDGSGINVFRLFDSNSDWEPQSQDDVFHLLPDDPRHVLISIDYDGSLRAGVFKLDVTDGSVVKLVEPRSFIQNWLADREGVVRLGYGLDFEELESHTIVRKPGSKSFKRLEKIDLRKQDGPWLAGLDCDDPSRFYVLSSHETGKIGLYVYDVGDETIGDRVFLHERFDVSGPVLQCGTGCLIGIRYVEHSVRTVYFEEPLLSLQERLEQRFADRNVILESGTHDGRHWIVRVSGPTTPTEYYSLEVEGFELELWASAYPELDTSRLVGSHAITYDARDGVSIPAYLTYPPGERRTGLPAVVLPHGGPWARDFQEFDYLAQHLASRGYVVFKPNFRGSAGFGDNFSPSEFTAWGKTALADIEDGAHWLIGEGIVDPERLCIVGASFGGYAALMSAILEPELYRCVVSLNGVTDPPAMLRYAQAGYAGGELVREGVLGDRSMKELHDYSPRHNLKALTKPVLLLHAKKDRNVRFSQSKLLAKALKKEKKDARFVPLPDDNHYLLREQSRITFLRELEAFLERHLKRKPVP